jgi:hypothetical protein
MPCTLGEQWYDFTSQLDVDICHVGCQASMTAKGIKVNFIPLDDGKYTHVHLTSHIG